VKLRRNQKSKVALARKREMQKKRLKDTSNQDEDTLNAKVKKPRKN